MRPEAARKWHELARRTGDGVEVALLCNKSADLVKVVVSDARLCHHVDLELAGAGPLSAFRESFAYATTTLQPMSSASTTRP